MHARQADQTSLFAPVDAATAFANLYQRWFDDPRGLARANRHQARRAIGSYVADVLAPLDDQSAPTCPARLPSCDSKTATSPHS